MEQFSLLTTHQLCQMPHGGATIPIFCGISDGLREGCPIYPHRVESSMVDIDSSHRKSSGERLSVKYTKDMG